MPLFAHSGPGNRGSRNAGGLCGFDGQDYGSLRYRAVAGSRLIGMQEAIFGRPLPPFGRVCNHSLWAIGAPFSATERLINSTKNATTNVNTAIIQKLSK